MLENGEKYPNESRDKSNLDYLKTEAKTLFEIGDILEISSDSPAEVQETMKEAAIARMIELGLANKDNIEEKLKEAENEAWLQNKKWEQEDMDNYPSRTFPEPI